MIREMEENVPERSQRVMMMMMVCVFDREKVEMATGYGMDGAEGQGCRAGKREREEKVKIIAVSGVGVVFSL